VAGVRQAKKRRTQHSEAGELIDVAGIKESDGGRTGLAPETKQLQKKEVKKGREEASNQPF